MDPALRQIWSALQASTPDRRPGHRSIEIPDHVLDPTPESLRDQAYVLSSEGERREAAYVLRRAVNLADSLEAAPPRMIPLLESLAEVLWQLGERLEARLFANRAIELRLSAAGEPASGSVAGTAS